MLPAQVIKRMEALGEISKQGKRLNGVKADAFASRSKIGHPDKTTS
jgi:hypothetical protein